MDEGTAPSAIRRHSAHTGTPFSRSNTQTHTHTRPHAIIPRSLLNCYSTSGHCYIRGCSQTEFFGLTSIIVQANRMSECVISSPAPVSLSAAWV